MKSIVIGLTLVFMVVGFSFAEINPIDPSKVKIHAGVQPVFYANHMIAGDDTGKIKVMSLSAGYPKLVATVDSGFKQITQLQISGDRLLVNGSKELKLSRLVNQ